MKRKLILSCVFLILFLLVLIWVVSSLFLGVDNFVNSAMAGLDNKGLIQFSSVIDVVFDATIMIPLSIVIVVLLFILGRKKFAWIFGLTMIADGVIIYIVKNLVDRVRPAGLIEASGFSFPSGHVTTAVVFFGLLIYLSGKKKNLWINTACIFMMLIIAFSRIYLNVHWLSDVFAGIFLGLGILFLGIFLGERVRV